MKKVLLGLLTVIVVLGVLGAAGFAGYRYGFNQGMLSASNGDTAQVVPGFGFGAQHMPIHNFGNDEFNRRFSGGPGFNMMHRGMGFGMFAPLLFLLRVVFWVLVIWALYTLVARSGWRLTKTVPVVETAPTDSNVENKESDLP
jgi:uncharacterized membrane protein